MHRLLLCLALVACGAPSAPASDPSSPAGAGPARAGAIYVALGQMGSNTRDGDALAPVLRGALADAFRDDPRFEVDRVAATGFHVDGVLTVTVRRAGRGTAIRCKLDLLVSTHPSKAIFGLPSSTAEVGATTAAAEIEAGRRDCIRAVAADLVRRHVIPMLRARVTEEDRDTVPP